MVYELKCSVCGKQTGTIEIPEDYKGELTNEAFGIGNIKCDEHNN